MKDLNRLKAAITIACNNDKNVEHNGNIFNIWEYDFYDDKFIIYCSNVTIEVIIDNIKSLDFKVFGTEVEISIGYDGSLYTYRIV